VEVLALDLDLHESQYFQMQVLDLDYFYHLHHGFDYLPLIPSFPYLYIAANIILQQYNKIINMK
jgi:hypothetical protein